VNVLVGETNGHENERVERCREAQSVGQGFVRTPASLQWLTWRTGPGLTCMGSALTEEDKVAHPCFTNRRHE